MPEWVQISGQDVVMITFACAYVLAGLALYVSLIRKGGDCQVSAALARRSSARPPVPAEPSLFGRRQDLHIA